MISCTRVISFDAAHRVMEHEHKCKYLHGHRYSVEVTFVSDTLDRIGRVIDFGFIKEIIGKWIYDNWDHATILYEKDLELGSSIEKYTEQRIFYLPKNPTAENMADYLLNQVCKSIFIDKGIKCESIRLYETPQCYVEVRA